MAASLDTLRVARRLREAGFSKLQAETVTDVLREAREVDFAQFATKSDLAPLVTKADLEVLRTELRIEIATVKTDLLKWLVPLLLGQAALIATLVRLF
jgi:hypothetical protein